MKYFFSVLLLLLALVGNTQEMDKDSLAIKKPVKKALIKQAIITETAPKTAYIVEKKIIAPDTITGLQEVKDERLDLLIQDYRENKKMLGYRVQIFSSSSNKWEAVKARSEFLKKYPDMKSYLIYQAPNFKVRVGDFTNRLKANQYLEIVKEEYPTSFIVKDEVAVEIEVE